MSTADVMNVQQFVGSVQAKQDDFANSVNPPQQAQPSAAPAPVINQEVANHPPVNRSPAAGSTSTFSMAPKIASVLGKAAKAF